MIVAAPTPGKIWTEEDLLSLPNDGYTHELIDGKLIMSPKNNFFHGRICTRLLTALSTFSTERKLGLVLDSSTGFWMQNRNCRAPDVSFISVSRIQAMGFDPSSRSFFPGAPDLAIEVISPSNTAGEIQARLDDFFSSGTQIAWIIHPEEQFVEVCHSAIDRRILGPGALLDGEQLLPEFQFPIGDLFKTWDWA
jgi:Uma2 family endonuclease